MLLTGVGFLTVGVGALFVYADTEFTVCYGIFKSKDAAERAADAGGEAGFEVDVDHRGSESAVEFESGETGEDAREPRRAFRQILRRERGISGHDVEGCLERGPFDH